jgi:hypothetical protein
MLTSPVAEIAERSDRDSLLARSLEVYAHLFRKDDGKAAAAIDALFSAP